MLPDELGLEAHYWTMLEPSPTLIEALRVRLDPSQATQVFALGLCDELVVHSVDSVPGSLRDAVSSVRPGGSVCFDPAHFDRPLAPPIFLNTEIFRSKKVGIYGSRRNVPEVHGSGSDRVFSFIEDATIRRLHLRDGEADFGGLILAGGDLELRDIVLEAGMAFTSGGAVYGDSLVMEDSTVRNCEAWSAGGGLHLSGPSTIEGSELHDNTGAAGGAVFASGPIEVRSSSLHHNDAAGQGGSIAALSGLDLLDGTLVYSNTATKGGGVWMDAGSWSTIAGSSLYDNTAEWTVTIEPAEVQGAGGGIALAGGTLEIREGAPGRASVADNHADNNGGGVLAYDGIVILAGNGDVQSNTADHHGGGFHLANAAGLVLRDDALVLGNTAANDGGGARIGDTSAYWQEDRARVEGNTAEYGGGVFNAGTATLDGLDPRIIGNTASVLGGGVHTVCGGFTITQPAYQVTGNTPVPNVYESCP